MQPSRRAWVTGVLLAALIGLVACSEGGEEPLTYEPGLPLHAQVADSGREGALRLEQVTYASADGKRVPALFALSADREPLGCLVYQGRLGQTKEELPELRGGAAAPRLAAFTIHSRHAGARASRARALRAMNKPKTLLAMLRGTVVDLRMGLDYLMRRPECRDNVAYLGSSFGGAVGVLFAAQDRRIRAVLLTSIGATYKQAILVGSAAARQISGYAAPVPPRGRNRPGAAEARR